MSCLFIAVVPIYSHDCAISGLLLLLVLLLLLLLLLGWGKTWGHLVLHVMYGFFQFLCVIIHKPKIKI